MEDTTRATAGPICDWRCARGYMGENPRAFLDVGQGFSRPNLEVLLPVSPSVCLHLLPTVNRTRPVITPAPVEVNIAQASFATKHCFTNIRSLTLDKTLQAHFGKTQLGANAFTLGHQDYRNELFDILNKPR